MINTPTQNTEIRWFYLIRAIRKSPLFRLIINIFALFSIGSMLMLWLGNSFNLNASEACGFFQGIGTIVSIITGLLIVNHNNTLEKLQQREERKHSIYVFKSILFEIVIANADFSQEDYYLSKLKNNNNNREILLYALRLQGFDLAFKQNNIDLIEEHFLIAVKDLISLNNKDALTTLYKIHDRIMIASKLYANFCKSTSYNILQHPLQHEKEKIDNLSHQIREQFIRISEDFEKLISQIKPL